MATAPFTCFAIAAPGLEPIVAKELTALGERPRIDDGGVSWEGDARSVMRANLWLRTASRVLVRLATFRATEFYELEKRAKKLPWEEFVGRGRTAEFRVTARKSKLYHSDAIAERLEKASRAGPGAPGAAAAKARPTPPVSPQLFVVRVLHDEFTISADTSGELLHMRGYRQAVGKAPLRETLAAALLLSAGWGGDTSLIDPLCGSGTIPIEGALIARGIAPGIQRRFAFMEWPAFDAGAWSALKTKAGADALARSPVRILGSDRDAGVVEAARANADRAGVAGDVQFEVRALSEIERSSEHGFIVTNPPYGVRVGDATGVRDLYAQLGNALRARCVGWRAAMYAPDPRLVKQTRLMLREMFRTSNGGIKVAAVSGDIG